MEYLKIYTDFVVDMEALGDAERGRLFTAMLNYAADGTKPELRGSERIVWPTAKKHIDRAFKSNEKRVNSSRENGKKGGRPKNAKPNETQENPLGFQKPTKRHINTNTNTNTNTKSNTKSNSSHCGGDDILPPTLCACARENAEEQEILDTAAEFARRYFGRAFTTYELQEVSRMVRKHCESGDVLFGEEEKELLQLAFQSAADTGAMNLKYLRGVYRNFQERNIFGSGDYYAFEVETDRAAGKI